MHKSLISALAIAILGMVTLTLAASPSSEPAQAKKVNHYIGAQKCKNCHSNADNGNQFDCWTKSKHAEAFKSLASDAGKKLATEKGIADPQKDDKCTKCHVTGFGLADDQFKGKFDRTGVQCEVCHGPGEAHMAARMAAAAAEEKPDPKVRKVLPEGEIALNGNPKFCQGCHNAESPSFKNFCYHERMEKIAHYDPRGTRKPTTPLKECPCDDACECRKGACKDLPKPK
jgi:hypothetical protein